VKQVESYSEEYATKLTRIAEWVKRNNKDVRDSDKVITCGHIDHTIGDARAPFKISNSILKDIRNELSGIALQFEEGE